ncbi:hypothetical protein ACFV5G_00120 [Streptomyces sp. NPDC059766]|uniref:hypothetical protein n=1 Tax=Streptomyces sp. NPDC059766 TaxID=3346940 RepID=UPI00364B9D8A
MEWVVGIGLVLGLLFMALGVASIRTGWTLPWARRHVRHHRVYGTGALLMGASCVLQGLFYFGALPTPSWEVRFFAANALLITGILLLGAGQLLPARRRG